MPAMQPTGRKMDDRAMDRIRRFLSDYPDGQVNHEISRIEGLYIVTVSVYESEKSSRARVMATATCRAEEMVYDGRCLENAVTRAYLKAVCLLCPEQLDNYSECEENGRAEEKDGRIRFTKGKYRGRPLQEIFLEDSGYIRYIAEKEDCIENDAVIEECRRLVERKSDDEG